MYLNLIFFIKMENFLFLMRANYDGIPVIIVIISVKILKDAALDFWLFCGLFLFHEVAL